MEKGLKREINLVEAVLYGVGIILGAGIYALIGEATKTAGTLVWSSFLVGAAFSCLTGFSYVELTSMFPQAAAAYTYVKKASGNDLLAFMVGWTELFADTVAASAVALGFAGYFTSLFGTPTTFTAVILILILSLLSFWGIEESTKVNAAFTLIVVFGLAAIIGLGVSSFGRVSYTEAPFGIAGILSAASLIFFAYIGFEDLANLAEETEDAARTIPKAILATIGITTAIYVLVSLSAVSLVGWEDLAASSAPLALAASSAMGNVGGLLLSFAALFATASTVLVLLIVGSRIAYGMSRNGCFPMLFSRIHRTRRTPWIATTFVMVFSILFTLFGDIRMVAGITNFGIFLLFLFINASVILLRYREPSVKRPFKSPINIGKFPLGAFLGLLFSLLMILYLEIPSMTYGLLTFVVGIPIHFLVARHTPKSVPSTHRAPKGNMKKERETKVKDAWKVKSYL